jgi:hypothetical protein
LRQSREEVARLDEGIGKIETKGFTPTSLEHPPAVMDNTTRQAKQVTGALFFSPETCGALRKSDQ